MTQYRKIAALAAGAALILTAGCGKATEKIAEKAAEKALESETGNDTNVDFNTDDGSIEITDDEGNEIQIGSTDLPDDWPEDLNPPDSVTIISAQSFNDGDDQVMSVTGESDDDPADLYAGLTNQLEDAGYDISSNTESNTGGGTYSALTATNGTNAVTATVTSSDDGQVTVLMSVSPDET